MAKKKLSKKKRRRRLIRRLILLTLLLAFVTTLAIFSPKIVKIIKLAQEAKELVNKSSLDTFMASGTTVIYDTDGNELCTMRESKDMYYVDIGQIPDTLQKSFVVMEDKDFYKHKGIDFKAIIRAVIANTENDEIVQGASTITQQLAKNIFLSQEVTWQRKVKEIFVAWDLEKKYTKDQILEFYLNNIYFSNGYYGVGAAARGYFDKEVSELTVAEQVFIAAIPNNPTRYNPLTNYDNTVGRRDLILGKLYENDMINSMNYYTALDTQVVLAQQPEVSKNNSVETYARHCATESMMQANGFVFRTNFNNDDDYEQYKEIYENSYTLFQQKLLSGGYKVYTSINMDVQQMLQDAVDDNLKGYTAEKDGVYEMQAAATCIDNSTGNVVAIVGSRTQDLDGYTLNRAYQSYRQPGSSIKPIVVYTPYLQQGNTPDTIVTDEKIDGGPNNADGSYAGQMTLRTAVMKSKNTVAWKIYRDDITPKMGIGFLLNMGFHKVWMDKNTNAVALGGFTYGVSTEEMAGAYATIANDGMFRQPTCVTKITNTSGRTIVDTSGREVRVYDTNSCRLMTDMLRSVVTGGTGVGAEPSDAIVAGKTGTTNSNKDAYFCGYSQYYTMAVWTGYDYPKTQSSVKTLSIFRDFMEVIHKGKEKVEFKTASNVITKQTETQPETTTAAEQETSTQQETTSRVQATTKEQIQKTTADNTSTSTKATEKTTENKTKHTGEWDAPTQTDKVIE